MLIVTYTNPDEYLAELRTVGERTTVRSTIVREEVNGGVEEVRVISGYHDDYHYYELTANCGENWRGGDPTATAQADELVRQIGVICDERGLLHRGGQWQVT